MKVRHPEKINKPTNPIKKKPSWIRTKILDSQNYFQTKLILKKKKLHTVCQEASCPNVSECWSKKHATFLIMGDICTRACSFCNVKTGKPNLLDPLEPLKIAETVKDVLDPIGVAIIMEGQHMCMQMRGVEKQNSLATTSSMLGKFRESDRTRSEFLSIIGL